MPRAPATFRAPWAASVPSADALRGSAAARGYGRRWQKLAAAFLARHPVCMCAEECGRPATEVDHVRPHRGDQALMWDWDNLQALTKECHSRKTAGEKAGRG